MHDIMMEWPCCDMLLCEAPKTAPFYWGIKDVQYNDGSTSRTWKQSMLAKAKQKINKYGCLAD